MLAGCVVGSWWPGTAVIPLRHARSPAMAP